MKLFASHDWGEKSVNHNKVKQVVLKLRALGHEVWFDEDEMKGNVVDHMCSGIDEADAILVFVTRNYIAKVGSGRDEDNCRREFMYAQKRRGVKRMIPIRFEASLPPVWTGPVGMLLGEKLYADLSSSLEHQNILSLIRLLPSTTNPRNQMRGAVEKTTTAMKVMDAAGALCVIGTSPPPVGGVKERVRRLMEEAGMSSREDEHTYEKVKRMLASFGLQDAKDTPLVSKIALLEEQLGLHRAGIKT